MADGDSEMVERVARVLEPELWEDERWLPFGGMTEGRIARIKSARSKARAAIATMREPTDDVSERMSAHASNGMVDWRDLHYAMIDAALGKPPA